MRRHLSRRPQLLLILATLAAALVVAACGASSELRTVGSSIGDGAGVTGQSQPELAAPPVDQAQGYAGGTTAGNGSVVTSESTVGGPMIIRTGTMDLQVGDVDRAVNDATAVVTKAGGYVAGSQRSLDGDQPRASLTFRIPADTWDATLAALRATGSKVLAEQTSSDEVTAQVVDLDARLKNLRATEVQLLGVMQQAVKIPDILAVQEQLTTVQGEIEQLQAQRDNLADQAAQGTLTASFALAPAPVAAATGSWDPATVVADATAQLVTVGQNVASAAIWFAIVWLPVLLVLLVILIPLVFVGRRLVRRAARTAGPTDPTGPSWQSPTAA